LFKQKKFLDEDNGYCKKQICIVFGDKKMKFKKEYVLYGIPILLIIAIGIYYISSSNILFQFVCTEWSYKICTQEHTEYDYCPVYGDVTYHSDCDKCGSTTEKPELFSFGILDYSLFENPLDAEYVNNYGNKVTDIYCPSECSECLVPGGGSWNSGTIRTFLGWDYEEDNSVICYGEYTTVCKSCTKREVVGEEKCGSRVVCDNWEIMKGESVPNGAIDSTCSDGFESCGNGKCEIEYDETEENCPSDCGVAICYANQYKCEDSKLYQCTSNGFDWEQKDVCEYGCDGTTCCIPTWEIEGDWSSCSNNLQMLKWVDGCGNVKYDERECSEKSLQWTQANIIVGIVSILATISGAYFMLKKKKPRKRR